MVDTSLGIRLLGDRVLVRRDPPAEVQNGVIVLPSNPAHAAASDGPQNATGTVLAVGNGKWVPGEWWKVPDTATWIDLAAINYGDLERNEHGLWEWIPGHRQPIGVFPGQRVLFNARWNDFAAGEMVGTDCDGKGPLERPLPIGSDSYLHLISEGDIAGVLS